VAVDGVGDVFIADTGNRRAVEVPAGCASSSCQTTVGSGLIYPDGVAVDGAGDLFIADSGNNLVVEVPAGCTIGSCQTTVGTGLDQPYGLAVDGAGDVFISDTNSQLVVEVPAGCTSSSCQTTVGSGLSYPTGVAVDGAGDVFIVSAGNILVVEVQRSQPPALSFAATAVGNTSTDSPRSVTVENIGNQLLAAVAPGLSLGASSFVQVAGSGSPPDCTSTFSLAPGASCSLSVSFMPTTVGSIASAATFTDNALNAPAVSPATQSVALQGTGTQQTQMILFAALPNQVIGTPPFTVSATASSGLPVSFGSATPSVCTVSGATVTLVAVGTCSIQATQAGNTTYAPATPVTQSFQVTAADFALSSSPASATVNPGQSTPPLTVTVTPQGSFTSQISFSCTGLPALAACTFSPTTLTPNTNTVTTKLTIATTGQSAALEPGSLGGRLSPLYAMYLVLPAMLLGTAGMAAPKRRKLLTCFLVFLAVSGCLLLVACSSGSNSGSAGTPAGNYTITITGAATSTQHTTTVSLTVQ